MRELIHSVIAFGAMLSSGCHMDRNAGTDGVKALVREGRPSLESVPYALVVVTFSNSTPKQLHVRGYDIVWPKGRFTVSGSELVLDPGASKDWNVRVPASAGDIDALVATPADARVESIDAK